MARKVKKLWNRSEAWTWIRVAWADYQVRLAVIFVLIYLILQISVIRKLVEAVGVDMTWLNLSILLPLILVLILWQIVDITKTLASSYGQPSSVSGQEEIRAVLYAAIQQTTKPAERNIQVIGLTLRYGWTDIRRWIDSGLLTNWTISLTTFTNVASLPVPPLWDHDSRANLDDIREFTSSKHFPAKRVAINVFEYHHFPVIHGYRLGNGDLWISFVSWVKDGSRLSGANLTYEFVSHKDTTAAAVMKRKLFNSWLKASKKNPRSNLDAPAAFTEGNSG